jgi:hypothetical protein
VSSGRARRIAKRAGIGLAGGVLLLAGGAMLLLPGPGLLVIAAGFAVLATEFAWAERWVVRVKQRIARARDHVRGR